MESLVKYIRTILTPDDRKKFEELVADPDILIPTSVIGDIVEYLIGEFSGRPTERPATSGDGAPTNGSSLKEASSSQELTPTA